MNGKTRLQLEAIAAAVVHMIELAS